MSVIGAEVGIREEEEKVAEIEDAAAHQVGKYGFHLGHRRSAGGNKVLVPLLVARTRDQGDAIGATDFHQRLEYVAQRTPAAQQTQHHHRGSAYRLQQLFTSGRRRTRPRLPATPGCRRTRSPHRPMAS